MQALLQNLLGSPQQQQDSQDFVQRYQQGPPSEGYSDQEVLNRYQQVAPQLPPDLYQQSAEQAFARLSPQERQQFYEFMQQRAQQQGMPMPGPAGGGMPMNSPDPRALAQMTTQMHQQQPGFLAQLLGGGGGSSGGGDSGIPQMSGVQKAALAGIAAMGLKMVMDQRRAA